MVPGMGIRSRAELTPQLLLRAYADGFFPMAGGRNGPIAWYSPDPRAIFPLESFKVSRSLRQVERRKQFEVRVNTAFSEVMWHCAARDDTWISGEIIAVYGRLFEIGHAHSVETWSSGRLVGGLYGVAIGGAFFGESMFSHASNASKIALWYLVRQLRERGFLLLDTQFLTSHLASLGACEIPRDAYLVRLKDALRVDTSFTSPEAGM
jgi:leucyl/phenylalanyl-tRNA--protein transferase